MGIALPLALLALLGIGIPLWLHRVRRRLLREAPLPTLALLSRAAMRKKRTLTFRDKPLLYARIALVALFALALSRPFLSQIASYASERPIALAIVIDDSLSMGRKSKRLGTLFETAVSRARGVMNELAPDSEVSIILAGTTPRVLAPRTPDVAAVSGLLAGLSRRGARGTALSEAVGLAARELTSTKLAARELLVLTDCAAHADAGSLDAPSLSMRVECIPTRERENNAFIRDASLLRSGDPTQPAEVHALVSATENVREVDVSVRIDGKAAAEAKLTFTKGQAELALPIEERELENARTLTLRIETSDDLLDDNVRELSLKSGAGLSVLLVDGDPALNQRDDELRFAALALSLGDPTHPAPRVSRIDADGLASEDLDLYDVIVLANVGALSEVVTTRLIERVARGAGLLISGGDKVDPFAYRGPLGKLSPAVIRSRAYADPARAVDTTRQTSSILVPERGVGLETGRTTERLLVEAPGAEASVDLTFDDGSPLLLSGRHERGRIALFTTTLDDDWSDLPLTPGFVPLLHGMIRGLSTVDALPQGPHPAGTVLRARTPLGARRLYIVTPDGRSIDLPVTAPSLRIDNTAVVGVYRAFAAFDERGERELPQLSFSVIADPKDSDLTLAPVPKRAWNKGTAGVSRPKGVDPWMWLLFGLAAVTESALRLFVRRPNQTATATT